MKKIFVLLPFIPLVYTPAMAYQEMDYRYVTYGSNPTWSTSTWDIYSGPSSTTLVDYETEGISKYPNSNKVALLLNWNLKQLNVDGNYTVGKFFQMLL